MAERGGESVRHSTRRKKAPGDAMAEGLRHLARSGRTIAQMHRFLRTKGHPEAEIERVVSRLVEMGYLDDREYAERYIASTRSRLLGRARLAADLLARGVPRAIVDETLASSFSGEDESAALERALAKAVSGSGGGLDDAGRRRVASRLARRGFSPGKVLQAIAAMAVERMSVDPADIETMGHGPHGADDDDTPGRHEEDDDS